MRKHTVTFLSPGTFCSEQTTREIGEWNLREAIGMAETIVERHGAKPYGFYFKTLLTAAPVPDGEGGTLQVQPRELLRSGMHFLGGKVVTLDDIRARGDKRDSILLSNMECNDMPIVVENTNSYKSTNPFNESDCIVNADGEIVERGDTPERVAYRKQAIEAHRANLAALA